MESESECCSGCFAYIPVLTEVLRATAMPEGPVMLENILAMVFRIISN